MIGYHVTPKKNALAIRRHGLLARKPTEHNYIDYANLRDQPTGVYFHPDGPDSQWVPWGYSFEDAIAVEFDYTDMPIAQDPKIEDAQVVLCSIPPERIRSIKSLDV